MFDRNLAFIDTETTGLDFDLHEVIEIGAVLVKQTGTRAEPKFEVIEEFELKIKPQNLDKADSTALRINGYDEAAWMFAYELPQAMKIFADKVKDAIMVSHNTPFDYGFLDKAFKKSGVQNTMHYHKLDTISLAYAKLRTNEGVDKYSLRFLCEHFGIENKRAHTALSDARALFELYKKLMAIK